MNFYTFILLYFIIIIFLIIFTTLYFYVESFFRRRNRVTVYISKMNFLRKSNFSKLPKHQAIYERNGGDKEIRVNNRGSRTRRLDLIRLNAGLIQLTFSERVVI